MKRSKERKQEQAQAVRETISSIATKPPTEKGQPRVFTPAEKWAVCVLLCEGDEQGRGSVSRKLELLQEKGYGQRLVLKWKQKYEEAVEAAHKAQQPAPSASSVFGARKRGRPSVISIERLNEAGDRVKFVKKIHETTSKVGEQVQADLLQASEEEALMEAAKRTCADRAGSGETTSISKTSLRRYKKGLQRIVQS